MLIMSTVSCCHSSTSSQPLDGDAQIGGEPSYLRFSPLHLGELNHTRTLGRKR